MNTKHKSVNLQHRIKKHMGQPDTFSFFNLLTSRQLLSTVEELQPEYRERKYPTH